MTLKLPKNMGTNPADYGLVIRVVEVDAETAREWLDKRPSNRRLKRNTVERIKRDLLQGRFLLNGETIVFEGHDHESLIDGQNRLEAIVESGVPALCLIVWGVGPVMATMDSGTSRTLSDNLGMRGEMHAAQLASAVMYLWRHLEGLDGTIEAPSRLEAEKLLDRAGHPRIRDSVDATVGITRSEVFIPHGMAAFAHYAFTSIDMERGTRFFDLLESGANLERHDPILELRRVLIGLRAQPASWKSHQTKDRLAYIILAWNAWNEGRRVDKLRLPRNRDEFPRIVGDVLVP